MYEAKFFNNYKDDIVRCELCPHMCVIKNGDKGICGVRINEGGILYAKSYGKVSAIAIDPIEKKPLYHFYPGVDILSFGTIGCNFKCPYCQNWHISQNVDYPVESLTPHDAVDIALRKNIKFIAYTYSEPLIWYEFVYDTAKLSNLKGIKNVLVTNGYINKGPLKELIQFIDAANIDVKAFNERFYKKLAGGLLSNVIKTVEFLYNKIHIELTMLIIPGWNDNLNEIRKFVEWVYNLNPYIPVHFSKYFPQYKFDQPPTPDSTLKQIYEIAIKKLHFVFIGNTYISNTNHTYCPYCKNLLIERKGYFIKIVGIDKNRCKNCGKELPIVV